MKEQWVEARRMLNQLTLCYDELPSWGEQEERTKVEEWIFRMNSGERSEELYRDILELAKKRL